MQISLTPIGFVKTTRAEPIDDDWDAETTTIELDASQFTPDVLLSLDQFSHIEVIYWFHHEEAAKPNLGARRPRGRADWPMVGIFAQRAKNRPNRLGLTVCKLLSVDGLKIQVSGLDAIDGAPVVDIKPWMTGFAPRGEVKEPDWAKELMDGYW
jgi:tRNA-Thr(GGU) m(6)t(6)A37 methyltransferase TsaA